MSEQVVEILSRIEGVETIATGSGVDQLAGMKKLYGGDRWRKMKGRARVQGRTGRIGWAEIHWYECHGVGKRRIKVKRWLEPRQAP